MRVAKKTFTRGGDRKFFLINLNFIIKFTLKELLYQDFSLLKNKEPYLLLFGKKKNVNLY